MHFISRFWSLSAAFCFLGNYWQFFYFFPEICPAPKIFQKSRKLKDLRPCFRFRKNQKKNFWKVYFSKVLTGFFILIIFHESCIFSRWYFWPQKNLKTYLYSRRTGCQYTKFNDDTLLAVPSGTFRSKQYKTTNGFYSVNRNNSVIMSKLALLLESASTHHVCHHLC